MAARVASPMRRMLSAAERVAAAVSSTARMRIVASSSAMVVLAPLGCGYPCVAGTVRGLHRPPGHPSRNAGCGSDVSAATIELVAAVVDILGKVVRSQAN